MIVENYPQLKSNENFPRLQDELSGTENRIAVARGRYNTAIQDYNTLRRRFPANLTAKMFGFQEYPYFNAPPAAQTAPRWISARLDDRRPTRGRPAAMSRKLLRTERPGGVALWLTPAAFDVIITRPDSASRAAIARCASPCCRRCGSCRSS